MMRPARIGMLVTVSLIGFLLAALVPAGAQAQAQERDSLNYRLSLEEFLGIVRRYHPVLKQAALRLQMADAAVRESRAAFDPLLGASLERKKLAGEQYYSYWQPELRIPTWYGMELYAGAEEVSGTRFNPEETPGATSYAGLRVPLLKGLVTDKRRTALQQAKLLEQQRTAEQAQVLNDLLQQAASDYWEWVKQYRRWNLLEEVARLSARRLLFTRLGYQQGYRAAIDTLEARSQWEMMLLQAQDAELSYRKAGIELSNYCWLDSLKPYDLPSRVLPDTSATAEVIRIPEEDLLIRNLLENHPKLLAWQPKLESLRLDSRLKFQEWLPKLDLKLNALGKGYADIPLLKNNYLSNNYKIGFDFVMPLRFSAGRGAFRQAKLKQEEARTQWQLDQQLMLSKLRKAYAELLSLRDQKQRIEVICQQYKQLLQGENLRYQAGESTLFMVNSRENKWLEAEQKKLDLSIKLMQSYAALQGAAGLWR